MSDDFRKTPSHERSISLSLYRTSEHPCPYLPGLVASNLVVTEPIDSPAIYRALMDSGFRRSGETFYKPSCPTCQACVPIRVEAAAFRPSESQRRVMRRNKDVAVDIGYPRCDAERMDVYNRYQMHQHGSAGLSEQEYSSFLVESPIETLEMRYRIDRKLAGIGLVDLCPGALSSVYFYFDPQFASRSLGVLSAIQEIEFCRKHEIKYWYAGFYVKGSPKMEYKAKFQPFELIRLEGKSVTNRD